MDVKASLFYVFSAALLFAAFRVVTARNPVHAVLFLMMSFFQASLIWMLLRAEFLAITLVLVYLGAVMVLFLFVVMMLDIHIDTVRKGFWRHFPLAAAIGVVIALEMAAVLMGGFRPVGAPQAAVAAVSEAGTYSNTRELGYLLYTEYIIPVQIAAVILLVAIIAAIALTLRQRKDSKAISVEAQVRVRASDRLRVIQVAATKPAPPPEPIVESPPAAPAAAPAAEKKP